jgi:AcrR family transcriptional regulator
MAKGGTSEAGGGIGRRAAPPARRLAERPHEVVPLTNSAKSPRTARGELTRRKILDAARAEFGSRGFADTGITEITRTAKVALGTFYTYFHSKEEVFRALVQDMSEQVRLAVAPVLAEGRGTLEAEERALAAFLGFVAKHQQVYRIIDEAEFVDPAGFKAHYENTAARIAERLAEGAASGAMRGPGDVLEAEVRAWAVMGMNVFLGLRFGVWGTEDADKVAAAANRLLRDGLALD